MKNMDYLFWSHALFWVFIFGYIFNLLLKNSRLSRELTALESDDHGEAVQAHDKTRS